MGKVLEMVELGQPILRKKAKPVSDIFAPHIKVLCENMLATLEFANGVGLAAPQVGELLQIFIVCPDDEPIFIFNPKITYYYKRTVKDWEGCLSIPGIRGYVPRSDVIRIEFTDITGERICAEAEDFIARVFQHEYDHLLGKVFLDRLSSNKDIITEKEYKALGDED